MKPEDVAYTNECPTENPSTIATWAAQVWPVIMSAKIGTDTAAVTIEPMMSIVFLPC